MSIFSDVPTILMYHGLSTDETSKLYVSQTSFKKHLDHLSRWNNMAVPIETLIQTYKIDSSLIGITFDDGFHSCYTQAFPILEEFGQKAVFFIISSFIGKNEYMNASQIKELFSCGHSIGSHTVSHEWLPHLSSQKIREEVRNSKAQLEDLLGSEISIFAYPMGGLNETVVEEVRAAGYTYALATTPPKGFDWCNPFTLRRTKVSRTANNALRLWYKVSGLEARIKGGS